MKSSAFLPGLLALSLCAATAYARVQRILILGDSLTEGYGVARDAAFPARLEQMAHDAGHPEVVVINAGISGSTSASGPSRLRWQLQHRPDLLILELGANDGLRGIPVSEIRKNLSSVIEAAQAQHVRVLLLGMKLPPNFGPEYVREFNALFPELAARYQTLFMPFLLEGVAGIRSLNQEDGVHPTEEGQKIMAQHIFPYVQPLL